MPDLSEVCKERRELQLQEFYEDLPQDYTKENYSENENTTTPVLREHTEDLVARAERFAGERHAGQMRKCGVLPYIVHPAELVASLRQCSVNDPYILAAAWLHDTVEDTNTSLDEIYDEFGQSVCGLVDTLTRRKPDESHEIYNNRILSSSHAARLIKVTDTEHNMRTLECLDDKAQERKLREAKKVYLPLRDELCAFYDCAQLFDTLEGHINTIEGADIIKSLEQRTYVVTRKNWIESERGWGQKSFGYSLHLTEEDMKEFIKEHWAEWPDKTPEWYYGPDPMSSPHPFEIGEKIYQEIKESKNGIRR